MTTLDPQSQLIESVLRECARSLGASLAVYWPSDEHSCNDLAEANLTFHLAHAFLSRNFFVYAEADHPTTVDVQGIDLLAIAPTLDWCVACEAKRLIKGSGMGDLWYDLPRVCSFRLNERLREQEVGCDVLKTVAQCRAVYGLLAGLKWGNLAGLPPEDGTSEFHLAVRSGEGNVLMPIEVIRYPSIASPGAYFLRSAILPAVRGS